MMCMCSMRYALIIIVIPIDFVTRQDAGHCDYDRRCGVDRVVVVLTTDSKGTRLVSMILCQPSITLNLAIFGQPGTRSQLVPWEWSKNSDQDMLSTNAIMHTKHFCPPALYVFCGHDCAVKHHPLAIGIKRFKYGDLACQFLKGIISSG